MGDTQRDDLVYPELSYRIVGVLFSVDNELGYGYKEQVYEKAVAHALDMAGLVYREQLHTPLEYKDSKVGTYFLDFLIDGKVVLELKQGSRFSKKDVQQVYEYLKVSDLKLGILALFSPAGLKFKRIVNEK